MGWPCCLLYSTAVNAKWELQHFLIASKICEKKDRYQPHCWKVKPALPLSQVSKFHHGYFHSVGELYTQIFTMDSSTWFRNPLQWFLWSYLRKTFHSKQSFHLTRCRHFITIFSWINNRVQKSLSSENMILCKNVSVLWKIQYNTICNV